MLVRAGILSPRKLNLASVCSRRIDFSVFNGVKLIPDRHTIKTMESAISPEKPVVMSAVDASGAPLIDIALMDSMETGTENAFHAVHSVQHLTDMDTSLAGEEEITERLRQADMNTDQNVAALRAEFI